MAIFHCYAQFVSRSKGHSVVAAAAYRSGEKLYDELREKYHDYTKKEDVVHKEIIVPEHVGRLPAWIYNRERLWNEVERSETNLDGSVRERAQLAQEVRVALPRELTLEQNTELVRQFVKEQFVSKGRVADVAIHSPRASDEKRNPHAHILLTMREFSSIHDGFGLKNREWHDWKNRKEQLKETRKAWAVVQNRHLKEHGHDITVDHRSHKERRLGLIPTKHLGKYATLLVKGAKNRAKKSLRHMRNEQIKAENKRRLEQQRQMQRDYSSILDPLYHLPEDKKREGLLPER